jgi:hypothetical protein
MIIMCPQKRIIFSKYIRNELLSAKIFYVEPQSSSPHDDSWGKWQRNWDDHYITMGGSPGSESLI